MSNGTLARAVLDKLVDEDLIEIEEHDEAVAALTSALDEAASQDWVPVITEFLDECAMIDEIYGSDPELEAAIKSVLASSAA
jgi:hypothetical protein